MRTTAIGRKGDRLWWGFRSLFFSLIDLGDIPRSRSWHNDHGYTKLKGGILNRQSVTQIPEFLTMVRSGDKRNALKSTCYCDCSFTTCVIGLIKNSIVASVLTSFWCNQELTEVHDKLQVDR
jgi:hypothetical protein